MFELRRRTPGRWGAIALTLFLVVALAQASCKKEETEEPGTTDLATTGEPATTEPMGTDTMTSEPMGTDTGDGTVAARDIQVVATSTPRLAWKVTIDGAPHTGTTIPVKVGDKITWTMVPGDRHGVRFAVCNAAKAIMTFSPAVQPLGGDTCGTPEATSGPFTVGTVTAKPVSPVAFDCTRHGRAMPGTIVAAP